MVPGLWGSIIGMLGTLISRGSDMFEKNQDDKNNLQVLAAQERMAQIELEKLRLQSAADLTKLQAQAEISKRESEIAAEAKTMTASMTLTQATDEADKSKIGTMIRAGLRPILTILYTVGFLYVVYVATTEEIVKAQADAIFFAFIDTAVAITLWWFGIRKSDRVRKV